MFGDFSTDEKVYQDWDAHGADAVSHGSPGRLEPAEPRAALDPLRRAADYTARRCTSGTRDYRIDLTSYIGFGDFLFGLPSGTVLTVPQTVMQNTESKAAFFEGDYKFTELGR